MALSNLILPENAHASAFSASSKRSVKTVNLKIDDGSVSGSEIYDKTERLPFQINFVLKKVNNYLVTSMSEVIQLLEPYRTIVPSKKGQLCNERLMVYFVHCRRETGYSQTNERMSIRHPTKKAGCMYILVECHGLLNKSKDLIPGDGLTEEMLEGVYVRAPAGAVCRQHEMPQIYDNSVKCLYDGHDFEIPLTDDWLVPEKITYRFMDTFCNYDFHSQGTPRQRAKELRKARMERLPRSLTVHPRQSKSVSEHSDATLDTQSVLRTGGTLKRRRRKKRNTRRR
jgi:hypothetical protein